MSESTKTKQSGVNALRRAGIITLAAGAVVAIAAAFGPVWVVRAGIAIALVAGLVALQFAWKAVRRSQAEARAEIRESMQTQGQHLSVERQHNGEVLSVMKSYNDRADGKLAALHGDIDRLRTEINALLGEKAHLQADVIERDLTISRLKRELSRAEAELKKLRQAEEAESADRAEVVSMPRYAMSESQWAALPTAAELWNTGEHPSISSLEQLAFPGHTDSEARKQA
ncbi:hypothetical protein [Granulicoccus phenolivorans]|uniref:hypothetical protein n=1 Tax=Granulicoccus phenolivorans TaxID=266854 RepID=UPI0011AE4697|nr:hypothetical protein [Granulicoccus phenolivorans]